MSGTIEIGGLRSLTSEFSIVSMQCRPPDVSNFPLENRAPSQEVNGRAANFSVVPTGLWVRGASIPSDESLGYYRKSLRDKDSA